jgi:hypothetical protein
MTVEALYHSLNGMQRPVGHEDGRSGDMAVAGAAVVTRNGRDRPVMICRVYIRLNHRDRQVFAVGEWPDDVTRAVRNA